MVFGIDYNSMLAQIESNRAAINGAHKSFERLPSEQHKISSDNEAGSSIAASVASKTQDTSTQSLSSRQNNMTAAASKIKDSDPSQTAEMSKNMIRSGVAHIAPIAASTPSSDSISQLTGAGGRLNIMI